LPRPAVLSFQGISEKRAMAREIRRNGFTRGRGVRVEDRLASDGFAFGPRPDLGQVAPVHPRQAPAAPLPGRQAGSIEGRATGMAAARRVMGTPGAADMAAALANSGLRDAISDAEAARISGNGHGYGYGEGVLDEPRPTENLPAVISRAVAERGGTFQPTWHQVKHLPGYLSSPVRALGRAVFAQFTRTPIEDIQILCTLTNPEAEVRAIMGWISLHGIRDDQASLDFARAMPTLPGRPGMAQPKADVQVWNTQGYSFVLVRDPFGHYVYGMAGGRGVHLAQSKPAARIAHDEPEQNVGRRPR